MAIERFKFIRRVTDHHNDDGMLQFSNSSGHENTDKGPIELKTGGIVSEDSHVSPEEAAIGVPEECAQSGVQRMEAITLSWGKKSLIVVYVW